MFYYVLKDYKREIYQLTKVRPRWVEYVVLGMFMLSVMLSSISLFLEWKTIQVVIILVVTFLIYLGTLIFVNTDVKLRRKVTKAQYEDRRIKKLLVFLEDKELNNPAKIDWLISCCEDQKSSEKRTGHLQVIINVFKSVFIPLISVLIGVRLANSTADKINTYINTIVLIFAVVCGLISAFYEMVNYIRFPDRRAIECFEEDLKYIRAFCGKEE